MWGTNIRRDEISTSDFEEVRLRVRIYMHNYKMRQVQFKTLNFARIFNKVLGDFMIFSGRKHWKYILWKVTSESHFQLRRSLTDGCKLSKSWDVLLLVVSSQWPRSDLLGKEALWKCLCSNSPIHPRSPPDTVMQQIFTNQQQFA